MRLHVQSKVWHHTHHIWREVVWGTRITKAGYIPSLLGVKAASRSCSWYCIKPSTGFSSTLECFDLTGGFCCDAFVEDIICSDIFCSGIFCVFCCCLSCCHHVTMVTSIQCTLIYKCQRDTCCTYLKYM